MEEGRERERERERESACVFQSHLPLLPVNVCAFNAMD